MIADSITPDPPSRPPTVAGSIATETTTVITSVHYEARCPTCEAGHSADDRDAALSAALTCCAAAHRPHGRA